MCCNCVEQLAPEEYRGPKKASSTRAQKYLDSGVKRTFILAKGKGVPETYHNLKVFLEELKLTEIDSVNTYDLKLELICAGMENISSGKYPCHMCLAYNVINKGKYTLETTHERKNVHILT